MFSFIYIHLKSNIDIKSVEFTENTVFLPDLQELDLFILKNSSLIFYFCLNFTVQYF